MRQQPRRLAVRLTFLVLLAELVVLAGVGTVYVTRFFAEIDRSVEETVHLPGRLMNSGLLRLESVADRGTMYDLLGEELLVGLVVGSNGNVFYSLDPDHLGKDVQEIIGINQELFAAGPAEAVSFGPQYVEAVTPVLGSTRSTARFLVYVRVRTSAAYAEKVSIVSLFVVGSALTLILTTAIIILTFRWLILARLVASLSVLRGAERGRLGVRIEGPLMADEIGTLQRGINATLSKLQSGIRDLRVEIQERETVEQALRTTHETFLRVLDSIDATIYVADLATYEVLYVNRTMDQAFAGPLVGSLCHLVFRHQDDPCAHCTNARLLDSNGNPGETIVWEGQNPLNGRWYINFDRAIYWVDGRLARIQIATDVTDMKNLEEEKRRVEIQLYQAQKLEALGTLAGGIAHDFNNLMMGIQGNVSLALMDLAEEDPNQERLSTVEALIESATKLTRQLLGLAHGGRYEVKATDMSPLVKRCTEMFARTRKEIRLHLDHDEGLPSVRVDRGQIEQVLLNILVNAWQAMPEGGDVRVVTRSAEVRGELATALDLQEGLYVQVLIADTGLGMDRETLERAFDPFFTTKDKERGTGLGLASAYGIVKNHGGTIWAGSEPGSGSTFHIYLPAVSQRAVAEEDRASLEPVKGDEIVLLVDDETLVLDIGKKMLEVLGYRVYTAISGSDALRVFAEHRDEIALVILDIVMPDMGGGELFDHLKTEEPAVRTLISSGYSASGEAADMLGRGCDGFLQKPFTLRQLSTKLRSVLDG